MYENYPNIIGQYIGQNVVDDDGIEGFKYTHNSQNDVTLQLRMVSGIKRVCFSRNFDVDFSCLMFYMEFFISVANI